MIDICQWRASIGHWNCSSSGCSIEGTTTGHPVNGITQLKLILSFIIVLSLLLFIILAVTSSTDDHLTTGKLTTHTVTCIYTVCVYIRCYWLLPSNIMYMYWWRYDKMCVVISCHDNNWLYDYHLLVLSPPPSLRWCGTQSRSR